MGKIIPVLLAGGGGSRLWPLSQNALPKQFLPLMGRETLLQQAICRVSDPSLFDGTIVVTNAEYGHLVAEQIHMVGMRNLQIVLEPEGRNTAPASAVAAIIAARKDPESIILLMPVDHFISDRESFQSQVRRGSRLQKEETLSCSESARPAPRQDMAMY